MFLKKKYGAGYHLTIVFENENARKQMVALKLKEEK
jgi:hypothetical protein